MTRHDVIMLRQLADQTAISKEPAVPVPAEQLHELLDAWDDVQHLEHELERAEARIGELESVPEVVTAPDEGVS